LTLIDPLFIEGMARIQEIGDEKHRDSHWTKGVSVSDILNAMKRHTAAIERGEYVDEETGYNHAYAIGCGAMYIAHYCRNHGKYDEFFDQQYKGSAGGDSSLVERCISEEEYPGVLDKIVGGNSGTLRGTDESGRVGGRDAVGTGSFSLSRGPAWPGFDKQTKDK